MYCHRERIAGDLAGYDAEGEAIEFTGTKWLLDDKSSLQKKESEGKYELCHIPAEAV